MNLLNMGSHKITSKLNMFYLHLQQTYGNHKLDKVVTCRERLQSSRSPVLTLFTWQFDEIISPHPQDSWPLNWAGCWLQGGRSERKQLSHHRLLVSIEIENTIRSIQTNLSWKIFPSIHWNHKHITSTKFIIIIRSSHKEVCHENSCSQILNV